MYVANMPGESSNTNTPLGSTNNHNSSAAAQRHPSQAQAQAQSASPIQLISKIPYILPHERVFPIQIGSELYKLSGASLSSDGTSCVPRGSPWSARMGCPPACSH